MAGIGWRRAGRQAGFPKPMPPPTDYSRGPAVARDVGSPTLEEIKPGLNQR